MADYVHKEGSYFLTNESRISYFEENFLVPKQSKNFDNKAILLGCVSFKECLEILLCQVRIVKSFEKQSKWKVFKIRQSTI